MAPVLYVLAYILDLKKFHKISNKINMNSRINERDF